MISRSKATLPPTPALGTVRVSATRASALPSDAVRRDRGVSWQHPIGQELFRDALVRERKRAERFEDTFVLMLISLNNHAARQSRWEDLVEALSQTTVETDVIGWFEEGSVLGFIRTLADRDPNETATTLARTTKLEVMRSLGPNHLGRCSIRLEVYSPHSDSIPRVLVDDGNRSRTLQHVARDVAKRALDIVGSVGFLIVFSPVFILVSALVKLTSKGPVFFPQQRVGESGQPFMMLKFRTMHVNADHQIHQQYVESFIRPSETSGSAKNLVFKIVDDPRVTPVGHFLRRSSLDELPQFWNVLRGEMSLVGPRPPVPYEVARYKCWHRRRVLEAKPGITGLWQVTGRSRTTFDEMVRLDLRYARTYSVWTDLKILMATPRAVISGKGAH